MKARRDWIVLRNIGYLNLSVAEVGWRVEGSEA